MEKYDRPKQNSFPGLSPGFGHFIKMFYRDAPEGGTYTIEGYTFVIHSSAAGLWSLQSLDFHLLGIGSPFTCVEYAEFLSGLPSWVTGMMKERFEHFNIKEGYDSIMIGLNGTLRMVQFSDKQYMVYPDGEHEMIMGDLNSPAFKAVKDNMEQKAWRKMLDWLKKKFSWSNQTNPNDEYHLRFINDAQNTQLWTLCYSTNQKYIGLGNPFCDRVFANAFDIIDEGKLSVFLKEKFKEHGINGTEPKLWHLVDGNKCRKIIGEQDGGNVIKMAH